MAASPDHAIATMPEAAGADLTSGELTDELGCTALQVHAVYRSAGESLTIPPDNERVIVPLAEDGAAAVDRRIGRTPPGESWTVDVTTDTIFLVLQTPANQESSGPRWIDLDSVDYAVPPTSDIATAHLTPILGCTGMKANIRRLEPQQAVPLHTEGTQEELFVPLDGGGSMQLGDETVPLPPGSIARVGPDQPRSARNDGEQAGTWLMFGAPPTGDPTGWDPGATIIDDQGGQS